MKQWMLLPLRRYFEFSGRSRPREYWSYVLFLLLASIAINIIEAVLGLGSTAEWVYHNGWSMRAGVRREGGPLFGLFALATFLPTLAVAVRRLHDSDRSGWWLLLGFIPLIGHIWLLVLMIIGGTRGPNRFGADPVEHPPV